MNTKARIDMLEKRNEELTERLNKLEENRKNMFIHLTNEIKGKDQELKEYEEGAKQLSDLNTALLIGVALDYGGEIRVKKDFLKLLDEYDSSVEVTETDYVFSISKKGEADEEEQAE